MITFIRGACGSGKTTEILSRISESSSKGTRVLLIVPDQEVLRFERVVLELLPASFQFNIEILSFSRLYNRVCREVGGLSYSYITPPVRSLLMWKTIHDYKITNQLNVYKNLSNDINACDMMLATIDELKSNGISATRLESIIKEQKKDKKDDTVFCEKMEDIAKIYPTFDNLVSEKYSDSADDLSKLRDILEKYNFFTGRSVYIDSFYSFTGVQHQIIENIFKNADNTTVTIPLSQNHSNYIEIESIKKSFKKLDEAAKKYGDPETVFLTENKRASSPALAYLSDNLWAIGDLPGDKPSPHGVIVAEKCDNPYSESEAVSSHILELLRSGARCRDITIIARDAEKYRGIIDVYLRKSKIPYFFSPKTDLCAFPCVKLILLALKIKKYNWQRRDVIAYIKTGMCGIDPRSANLFEEYVSTWNINGKAFLTDTDWTMNPDGFTTKKSTRNKMILECANNTRKQIVEPLEKLFIKLEAAEDVAEMCKAIYRYLQTLQIEEQMRQLAKKIAGVDDDPTKDNTEIDNEAEEASELSPEAKQNLKQANEIARAYQSTLNVLADVAEALKGETATTEELICILTNTFKKAEIASIPTAIDEVTIVSASTMRLSNPKYVFVLGLCEGEFPAAVTDTGILSDEDRMTLKLSQTVNSRASDELMYVQRAFSAPSEKLYAFCHRKSLGGEACFPSLAFTRIEKLFPGFKPHEYTSSDFDYLIPSPQNAVSVLKDIKDKEKETIVRSALGEHIAAFSEVYERPVFIEECRIDPKIIAEISGDTIEFYPTSFEKYIKCPFNYFCTDILELREDKKAEFSYADIGIFIHHILETMVKKAIPSSIDEPILSDEEIIKETDEAIEKYINDICPKEMMHSARLKHLYKRLREIALLIIKNIVTEFSQSDFRPKFFELETDGIGNHPDAELFNLDDGSKMKFGGKIDRVDIYKKDDKVYIRVVDYKTGSKAFSIDDVKYGLNSQMLLYLYTLCRSKTANFREAIGISSDAKALPAGVVYLSTNISHVNVDNSDENDAIFQKASQKLVRTGLFLEDENILYAMNKNKDKNFLPYKNNSSEKISNRVPKSEFDKIFADLERTIIALGNSFRRGVADANPLTYGNSPCKYCQSKSICKNIRS